jgi:AAA domain-containing protein
MTPKPKTKFSQALELYVIAALLSGKIALDTVQSEELSKPGVQIKSALENLAAKGSIAPFDHESVLLVASEIFGAEKALIRVYLQKVIAAGTANEIKDIVQTVREREVLIDLVNAASKQLGTGVLDTNSLKEILNVQTQTNNLHPATHLLDNGIPPIPFGVPVPSLPAFTEASGGLFGVVIIGGETGVGKSCLAWQLALEVGRKQPVLYYDMELGAPTLLHRTGEICRGNLEAAKRAVRQVYIRESIRSLDADTKAIPPPATIVIDSIQKLPTSILHRRVGLDSWVNKAETLAKQGYSVIVTSEKQRSAYGQATAGGYKESGSIEYAASFGVQLIKDDETLKVICIKNRARPVTGLICTLERHPDRTWWFKEASWKTRDVD